MSLAPTSELMTLAYAGVFLGALATFEGLRQVISKSETNGDARNRRMRMIAKGASTEKVLGLLKPVADGWMLGRLPFVGGLPKAMRKAGLTINPWVFLAGCVAAALIIGALATTRVIPVIAVALALVTAFGIPLMLVARAGRKRMTLMVSQLPDALDLMSRGLRVGHPLNTTIATVATDMVDPIASEFGVVVDQIAYGDDLVNAFTDLANRLDQEDFRYMAVSIAIQHGTGGNLSDVLSTLSKVIRDRITMRKRITAISSEGRLTSTFLSGLPLFILAMTSITAPDYYIGVSDDPLFRPLAIIVAVLIVANYLIMRKLVNFRF